VAAIEHKTELPHQAVSKQADSATQGEVAEWGSDIVVDLMKAYGIEYVALNPGASNRGVEDSIVNYGGNRKPELIECLHEESAVAIAQGYAKVTGKPMAAMLHDVVGTMHASMAIYNAYLERIPVVIISGTGPLDTSKRRPWIDWIHTALIQGNLVRDYVKWDDQPATIESLPESFIRAYRVATTEPQGPAYLCLDAGLTEERVTKELAIPDVARYSPPSGMAVDPEQVKRISEMLISAQNPLVLAERLGKSRAAFSRLVELAETLSIPVVDLFGGRLNFPTTHPLDLTGTNALAEADVILALDTPNLFSALSRVDESNGKTRSRVRADARIIQIGVHDLWLKSMISDYLGLHPVDLAVAAESALALKQIIELGKQTLSSNQKLREKYEDRRERLARIHQEQRMKWMERATQGSPDDPISPPKLALEVWNAIKETPWVLVEGHFAGWARRVWDMTSPDQYVGHLDGMGLGYELPGAIGAALALRESGKLCVGFIRDGGLLYTDNAIWTAAHHRIPLLVIVYNNRNYGNSFFHREDIAAHRSRPKETSYVATEIDHPSVGFTKLAEAFGQRGYGPIETAAQLQSVLKEAIRHVREERELVLIDTVMKTFRRE
jgi:acetolactate synthase I/II/III large subunit